MGVVALDCSADHGIGQVPPLSLFNGHDEKTLGPGARHDTVEQGNRIGDRAGVEILLERQRLLHKRVRIAQGIGTLRNADPAEILACRAIFLHVPVGQKREIGIRPPNP